MLKHPFRLKELLVKLRLYSIVPLSRRGKGSEIILLKPKAPESKKGPQYPVKNHGAGTEISVPVINAILRRFNIDENDFWNG